MKISRNSESLWYESTTTRWATMFLPILFACSVLFIALVLVLVRAPVLIFGLVNATTMLVFLYWILPLKTILVFTKGSQQMLMISIGVSWPMRRIIDFDKIQDVQLKNSVGSDVLSIVLVSGQELPISVYNHRCEAAQMQMHEDAELLRETLGLPEHEAVNDFLVA